MKKHHFFFFFLIITFIFHTSAEAQNEIINVYDYVDINDPNFLEYYNICLRENNISLERQKMANNSTQQERNNFCKDELVELSKRRNIVWKKAINKTVYVHDGKQIALLKKAIYEECRRLKELEKNIRPKYHNKACYDSYRPLGDPTNIAGSYCAVDNLINVCKIAYLKELVNKIKIGKSSSKTNDNSNLEAEFLAEIAKINSDITVINRLAQRKDIVESFGSAQILCDKLRRYQGDQYFSRTLKKIRKENPGFSFSITHLAEEVTREYWIRMRNRANHAYRNALDAHKGCVWNEGIQDAGYVEIPYAYAKLTFDLFSMAKDMMSKSFYGTLQGVYEGYQNPSESLRPVILISEDILAGGTDAYDWKTYAGLFGGVISAYDNFGKAWDMVVQQGVQGELIYANRQSAQKLIKSSKNLLQQFDRYRAFIDSHSSSIDCLNDRIMRIDLDNKSIVGDKITIWGTGNFDWDGEEFIAMIKEAGEDLKNEYLYCEDFIKTLQIAVNLANTDYYTIEEKVKNSGADQTQINAQLSYNQENGEWFENESTRLSEYYVQFCENNTYPDDVIIVSNQVIPSVEDQDGDPDVPSVWEYDTEPQYEYYEEPVYNEPIDHEPDYNPHRTGGSGSGIVSSGAGWSAQSTTSNQNDLQNDITAAVNSGKTPAGIYVGDDGEVVIYYIDDNPLGMTSWNLEWYDDVETLQNGINTNLEQGYFPMGISFTNQGQLYVLYIMSQLQASAWQLVESELDLGYVTNDVQSYINENYIPVGITVFGGMYYTLLAQVPDSKPVNWTIEGYENNNYTIQQGVNNAINSGFVPFGYLKEEGVVNLLYIGF